MIYVAIRVGIAYSFSVTDPTNPSHALNTVAQVVAGLRGIGYNGSLLEEDYRFLDWFSPQKS